LSRAALGTRSVDFRLVDVLATPRSCCTATFQAHEESTDSPPPPFSSFHKQVFICILKFDYFFFLAFSLQLVFLVPTQTAAERWFTVAALPITLSVLVLGFFAVKKEHRGLFWTFLVGCAVGCAYFVYKVRVAVSRSWSFA
jgi:hypothetical protein